MLPVRKRDVVARFFTVVFLALVQVRRQRHLRLNNALYPQGNF